MQPKKRFSQQDIDEAVMKVFCQVRQVPTQATGKAVSWKLSRAVKRLRMEIHEFPPISSMAMTFNGKAGRPRHGEEGNNEIF